MASLGVVVVTWNSASTLEACLASVPACIPLVVVDNASTDESVEVARATRPDAQIVTLERNVGFGAACNLGARQLGEGDVMLLNPDAILDAGTIAHLASALDQDPTMGIVGPLITDHRGRLELSWGEDPTLLSEWRRQREHRRPPVLATLGPQRVDWVTGACCLIRRVAWEAVSGFDERYFLYFEDLDLCRRVREHGFGIQFDPRAVARHVRGVSAAVLGANKARRYRASQLQYYRRYASRTSWLALRLYLALKFLLLAARTPREARVYAEIVRMALVGGEHSGMSEVVRPEGSDQRLPR